MFLFYERIAFFFFLGLAVVISDWIFLRDDLCHPSMVIMISNADNLLLWAKDARVSSTKECFMDH